MKQLPQRHELLCEKISRELQRKKKKTKTEKELDPSELLVSTFEDFLEELNHLTSPILMGEGDANSHFCQMHQ